MGVWIDCRKNRKKVAGEKVSADKETNLIKAHVCDLKILALVDRLNWLCSRNVIFLLFVTWDMEELCKLYNPNWGLIVFTLIFKVNDIAKLLMIYCL